MAALVREIMIDASPETIFRLLSTTGGWLEWEGTEAEIDARPGGTYFVNIAGDYPSRGEFVEVVPNEKIVWTFGWDVEGNPIQPGSTTVTITLHPDGDKTRLRMVHAGLPADAVDDHSHGWDHYLARLDTAASGGDPGPDTGPGDPDSTA